MGLPPFLTPGQTQKPQSFLTGVFVFYFDIVFENHTFLADLAATYSPKP